MGFKGLRFLESFFMIGSRLTFDRCTFYGLCKIYKIKGVAFSKDQGPF